jgi:hypothetical protein
MNYDKEKIPGTAEGPREDIIYPGKIFICGDGSRLKVEYVSWDFIVLEDIEGNKLITIKPNILGTLLASREKPLFIRNKTRRDIKAVNLPN